MFESMSDQHPTYDERLSDRVKSLAIDFGADLVGIASSDRYAQAPIEMSPEGHLPGATSVIVSAIHHPDAVIELAGEQHPQLMGPYGIQMSMNYTLDGISFGVARWLEDRGYRAVAIPASNIWHYRPRGSVAETFAPDLSHIHAAAAAGLGEIGYSGLLMTPEYGTRQRFCSVITDAPLQPDPLYHGPPLCDMCFECVRECPMDTFTRETAGMHTIHIGDKEFTYCNKNKWRCAWAEHFALDLELDLPDVVDEAAILDHLARYGRRGGAMGRCIKVCLPPHLRMDDPEYSSTVRRRRGGNLNSAIEGRPVQDRPAGLQVTRVLQNRDMDMISFVGAETCRQRGFDLIDELPDGRNAIVFGYSYAPEMQDPESSDENPRPLMPITLALTRWLGFAELQICQELQRRGYSALPGHHIDDRIIAEISGLVDGLNEAGRPVTDEYGARIMLTCVLTEAPLAPMEHRYEPDSTIDTASEDLLEMVSQIADRWGADLIGIADPHVIDETAASYREQIDEEPMKWSMEDQNRPHGPVDAVIHYDEYARIHTTGETLAGARSVIVVGYHFPLMNMLRGAEPPARAVGPYAFATYQTNRWLRFIGTAIARALNRTGYRAVISEDLTNSGSLVANPRGLQADALSNRFAAVSAGLAHIGLHGAPITPEYGVTQRFISIVTDAPLPYDEPLSDPSPCDGCDRPCLAACPVAAFGKRDLQVCVDGRYEKVAEWDRLRCEWAKRYALVGDEGPRWIGQKTDILPPEGDVNVEDIREAYEQKDPVQKHLTCILEPCLKACQVKVGGRLCGGDGSGE